MPARLSRSTATTPSSRVSTLAVVRSLTLRALALTSPRATPRAALVVAATAADLMTLRVLLVLSRSPVLLVFSVPSPSSSAFFEWLNRIDYAPSMWARQHSYTQLHIG